MMVQFFVPKPLFLPFSLSGKITQMITWVTANQHYCYIADSNVLLLIPLILFVKCNDMNHKQAWKEYSTKDAHWI